MKQVLIRQFVEEFQIPSVLEETRIANLLGNSRRFIALDQYRLKNPKEQKNILEEVSGELVSMDIYKGCCCAFFCGIMIGQSGPGAAGKGLVDFFAKVIPYLCRVLDKAGEKKPMEDELDAWFAEEPDAVRAYRGSAPLMMAMMDLLAKSPESRAYLRQKQMYEQLERIAPFVKNGSYLLRIYPVCGPMEFIVLAPKKRQGAVARVQDVGTNFHLMTLLERALWMKQWDQSFGLSADVGKPENQRLFAFSCGEEDAHQNCSVWAHASYLSGDGQMIWGEMEPESIPCFDGKPVVLIYPETVSRSWDLYFAVRCHPFLSPLVELERRLSEEEVVQWMGKIKMSGQRRESDENG